MSVVAGLAPAVAGFVGLAIVWVAVGAVLGGAYFGSLYWAVHRLTTRPGALIAAASHFGRLAVLTTVLALIAVRFGAGPLIASGVGILVGRAALIRFSAA